MYGELMYIRLQSLTVMRLQLSEAQAMNVVAYLRVSTQEQADSGLGLEAQRAAIKQHAKSRDWKLTQWCVDDGYTAATLQRPALIDALAQLRSHKADALVVSKLDRLSRSLLDFAGLMEMAQREGWAVIALDLGVDMTTPAGEMLANVMASFAQYERRLISQRTRDALQALKARGERLGRPVQVPPTVARRIRRLRANGHTHAAIAARLNKANVPTVHNGRRWYASTVRGVLRSVARDAECAAARSLASEVA